jgi:hypothetical protein
MATISWPNVQTWIGSNPHQMKALAPFKWAHESIEGPEEVTDADGWIRINVAPPTPLSAILLAQDSMYQALPEHARFSVLRDTLTELQTVASNQLKGRQWPVRRTNEGLTACGLTDGRPADWTDIGWRALATLRECQIILVNHDKQTISFFPEDVRTWSSTYDTLWIDHECRYSWSSPSKPNIKEWLATKEQSDWTIGWPEAEGTMDELKQAAQKVGEPIVGKIMKDALMKRVGRAQAIHTLASW